jgi:uncharacterized protein (TIGR03067 family)
MKCSTTAVVLAATLALICGCGKKNDAPRSSATDDKTALQKTWYAVYAERNGEYHNDPVDGQAQAVFTSDSVTITVIDGPTINGRYQIDPSKSPKEIDLTHSPHGKTETVLGIYLLDGDVFHLYFAQPGKPRPTELVSKPGCEYIRFRSNLDEAKAEVARFKAELAEQYAPKAKVSLAEFQVQRLTQAVESYVVKFGEFPNELGQLAKPAEGPAFVEAKDIIDPWGVPYRYDPTGPKHEGAKPDIWTEAPGKKVIGNWMSK